MKLHPAVPISLTLIAVLAAVIPIALLLESSTAGKVAAQKVAAQPNYAVTTDGPDEFGVACYVLDKYRALSCVKVKETP